MARDTEEKVRQGETSGRMRRVLTISIAVAIVLVIAGILYTQLTPPAEVPDPPVVEDVPETTAPPTGAQIEPEQLEAAPTPEGAADAPATAPAEEASPAPAEDATEAPADDAAPAEDASPAPAEDAAPAPAEDAAPAEEASPAPAEDATEAPADETTPAPAN